MQTIEAKMLKPGDKIIAADDNVLTVKSVGPGMMRGSVMIEWCESTTPPWTCVPKSDHVYLSE